jgi:GTP cyclohydrolase II
MLYRTHLNHDALLPTGASSDAMDALLHDLVQTRARKRPRGRPFVTLAYAQSIDGSISIARGQRSALSGPESLRYTHALRAGHDGILVGVGTVLADDPELRVRLVDGRDPQPVIVDSHLSTPIEAKLLAQSGRNPWIGTTTGTTSGTTSGTTTTIGMSTGAPAATLPPGNGFTRHANASAPGAATARSSGFGRAGHGDRRARIEARGGRILACDPQPNGWVDLSALLRQLYEDGIEHLMVEGGARIITSFLDARLVDYVTVTIAPMFMGGLSAVGRLTRGASSSPTPGAPAAPVGPALGRWVSARLGHDLVLSGEVAWPAD